jgi:hypothetical protein
VAPLRRVTGDDLDRMTDRLFLGSRVARSASWILLTLGATVVSCTVLEPG